MHPGNNSTDASTDLKGADNLGGGIQYAYQQPWDMAKTLLVITFDERGGFVHDHKKPGARTTHGNEDWRRNTNLDSIFATKTDILNFSKII